MLLHQSLLYRSLYALLSMGVEVAMPGLPRTVPECTRRSLSLFDRMLRASTQATDGVSRLRLLSSAYDLLNGTTVVADFHRTDRWNAVAEHVVETCLGRTSSGGLEETALCRCLTDYFYGTPSPEGDGWYAFLQGRADAWCASFVAGQGWSDAGLEEGLERVEVLNRLSYMFLDHSRDGVARRAFEACGQRMQSLDSVPFSALEWWYVLNTSGNACPPNVPEARRTFAALCRRSPDSTTADSYRLAWECWKSMCLAEACVPEYKSV